MVKDLDELVDWIDAKVQGYRKEIKLLLPDQYGEEEYVVLKVAHDELIDVLEEIVGRMLTPARDPELWE